MGWRLKALACVAAFLLLAYGGIGGLIFAIPLFVYVASGLIFRKGQGQRVVVISQPGQGGNLDATKAQVAYHAQYQNESDARREGRSRGTTARYLLGSLFLLLALVALASGGSYSPLLFAGVGLLVLSWGPASELLPSTSWEPARESILLRNACFPFRWMSVASVKLSTKQVGRALACIDERLLVLAAEEVSVLVPVRCYSLSHRRAEAVVMRKMIDINMASSPLGAWLLPLDSEQAAKALCLRLQHLKFNSESITHSFSVSPYDALSIETKEGYVEKLGMYRQISRGGKGHVSIPKARQKMQRRPLVWEIITKAGEKLTWPGPDSYTAFLTSVAATKDSTQGERIEEAGRPGDGSEKLLHVRSMSGTAVELSRAQLRAVMGIYCRPSG